MADFLLTFVDSENHNLFSAVGRAIPRRGEVVSYVLSTTLTERERADWDDEALAYKESLQGKQFEVTKVHHEFRKSLVMKPETHLIFVVVREIKGE